MDFFHCNVCFANPASASPRTYYLSNCGHSFCSQCFETETNPFSESVCVVCKEEAEVIEIKKNAPLSVMKYFTNLRNDFRNTVKALCIQNAHSRILVQQYYPRLEKALDHTLREIDRRREQEVAMKEQISQLKAKMEKLKMRIDCNRSSVVSSPSPSPEGDFRNPMTMSARRVNYMTKTFTPASRNHARSGKSPWADPHLDNFRSARDILSISATTNSNRFHGLESAETLPEASSVPSFWRGNSYAGHLGDNPARSSTSNHFFTD